MSLISETFVHVLSANQVVAGKLETQSLLPGQVKVSTAVLAVPVAGLAVGAYTLPLDVSIPVNAFVYASILDTTVAITSGGAATVGVGLTPSTNNLTGGAQQALGVWAIGIDKYSPVVPTTVITNTVTVNVAVFSLLTGNVIIKILWV